MIFYVRILLILSLWVSSSSMAYHGTDQPCIQCHRAEVLTYKRSQMANAAATPGFLRDWQQHNLSEACVNCHSPTKTAGVICQDCHVAKKHAQNGVNEVSLCARCHDAPGENTVRSYLQSPAAKRGIVCSSCHLDFKKTGHEFLGPSTAGFMNGVARLKLSMRKQQQHVTAIIQIRHRAGHALPGGTIGRSAWLLMDAIDHQCQVIDSKQQRFGWVINSQGEMIDNSLSAGRSQVIEFPVLSTDKTAMIRVRLIYRFVPGAMDRVDQRQILLDEKRFVFRQSLMNCIDQHDGPNAYSNDR